MTTGPNLFARLHKWAARQDENFLTESLAVVLEQLLILAPAAGCRLISRLTGGFIDLAPDDIGALDIRTQVEAQRGRPDLEIGTPVRLVWIEVKVESALRAGQLEGYRLLLGESRYSETRLILLSRYPEEYAAGAARPDMEVRWFEVAEWLESELSGVEAASEIGGFLARQFLDFLKERNMTLTQVSKYLPEGTRALSSLLNMLKEAAAACKIPAKPAVGWDYHGLTLDGARYWVGVNLSDPDKVWFGTRGQIDVEAARLLGAGELNEESWVPGRFRWWRALELDSEEVHFFARSKVGQMQCLMAFLQECRTAARSIEVPDQPPPPEDGEGD